MANNHVLPEKNNKTEKPANSGDIIDLITYKTRQGFIPQMHKVNQDSFVVLKDFAGIKDLWMLGVMDGHGVFGHKVSQYVKTNLPLIHNMLLRGVFPADIMRKTSPVKKKIAKKSKNYLPPLSHNN